jgi:hypothetical protein
MLGSSHVGLSEPRDATDNSDNSQEKVFAIWVILHGFP